jgi:hypothetical protein
MSKPVSIFEERFKGGHPNSLGNTIAIVDEVLADRARLQALMDTWNSDDEIVRLRVANAVRRVCVAKQDWIIPYADHLLDDISTIDQPSTQWTLAKLFEFLTPAMTAAQLAKAKNCLKHNLQTHPDWIVLNNTMETLALWAKNDAWLKIWLEPELRRLQKDRRKSVANRAAKLLRKMEH